MVRVTGIDHLVLSVGDFKASKAFYAPLMALLGFKLEAEYEGMMGWHNDKTMPPTRKAGSTNTARAISAFTTTRSA